MKNRLKGEETYEDIDGDSNVIRLLLLIMSIKYSYESKSYPVLVIHMALRKFYKSHQSISSSCDEYFEAMLNLRDVISHCGSVIRNHPFLLEKLLKAAYQTYPLNPMEDDTAAEKQRQKRPIWPQRSYQGSTTPYMGRYSTSCITPFTWYAMNIQRR